MCKSWTGKTQPHSLQTCGHCVRQTSHPTPLTPPWLSSLIPSSSFHGLWLWSVLITLSCSDLCDTEPYKFSQHLGHLFSLIFFWNLSPVLQLSPKLCFVGFGRDLNLHQYYSFFPVLFSSHLLLQVWGGAGVSSPSRVTHSADQHMVSGSSFVLLRIYSFLFSQRSLLENKAPVNCGPCVLSGIYPRSSL